MTPFTPSLNNKPIHLTLSRRDVCKLIIALDEVIAALNEEGNDTQYWTELADKLRESIAIIK